LDYSGIVLEQQLLLWELLLRIVLTKLIVYVRMKIVLNIKQEKCADSCPLPLSVLPSMAKGVSKADYDQQSGKVVIEFDETIITKKKVIAELIKMKYKVKNE